MALRAAWMWGFQESLGSSGKQHCALSWALLSSFSRSHHLQQPRAEEKLSPCNTDLAVTAQLSTDKLFLPLIYTYPTLLVSHFYSKLRDIYFPPSFLFPSPLPNSWMKPQKAKHNVSTPTLQTSSKMRQLLDCVCRLHLTHAAQTSTHLRGQHLVSGASTAQISRAQTSWTLKNPGLHHNSVPLQAANSNPPSS